MTHEFHDTLTTEYLTLCDRVSDLYIGADQAWDAMSAAHAVVVRIANGKYVRELTERQLEAARHVDEQAAEAFTVASRRYHEADNRKRALGVILGQ